MHYNEIQDINILEIILNNLSNLIISTLDDCIVNKKDEMLNIYADYMNNMYLTICQSNWNKNYDKIPNGAIIKLTVLIFDEQMNNLRIIDLNLSKNPKEQVKIYMTKTFQNLLSVIEIKKWKRNKRFKIRWRKILYK